MKQKPWYVAFLTGSLVLVPLTETGLYFFTTRVQNIHLPARIVTILWVFGIACLIASYGAWKVRSWGYILFLLFISCILSGELYQIIKGHTSINFWEILNISLVACSLIFVLNKNIATPYFNPNIRWWERSSRHRVDIPTFLKTKGDRKGGQLLDISATGCFVDTTENLEPGEIIFLDVTYEEVKFESAAKVIRHMKNPRGFGLKFIDMTRGHKKNIRTILSLLRSFKDRS